MKNVTTLALALGATLCVGSLAAAQEATFCGKVTTAHYNPAIADRGVCLQLAGVSVGGDPWFCNTRISNPLYNEINALVQEAALEQAGKRCSVTTRPNQGTDTHNEIGAIQCGTPGC